MRRAQPEHVPGPSTQPAPSWSAWWQALRVTSPPIEWPTRTTSSTGTGQAGDELIEQRRQAGAVVGDVQPAVVADVHRGEPDVAHPGAEAEGAVRSLFALRGPPRVLGLTQTVDEHHETTGRLRKHPTQTGTVDQHVSAVQANHHAHGQRRCSAAKRSPHSPLIAPSVVLPTLLASNATASGETVSAPPTQRPAASNGAPHPTAPYTARATPS